MGVSSWRRLIGGATSFSLKRDQHTRLASVVRLAEAIRMLDRLKIARFKSVKDADLAFGRVNLFIGGNGTGKSNFLEAIGLLASCLSRGLGDSDISAKGLRLTPPELMKSSFRNEALPGTLELHGYFENDLEYKTTLQSREGDPLLRFFSESALHKGERLLGRSNRGARATGVSHADRLDSTRGIWDQIKATHDLPDIVDQQFSQFARYVIYTPQTDFLRGRQRGKIDTPPLGLHGEGLPDAVESFLRLLKDRAKGTSASRRQKSIMRNAGNLVMLPGWAETFGVHFAKSSLTSRDVADRSAEIVYFEDRFMHTDRNRLSVYDSSEGTLFLLFAAIILTHPEAPKIFALDNVDNALNPRLTKLLVEKIVETCLATEGGDPDFGAQQVFLTSHNPTALDAIDLFDSNQRVFIVQRNEKGHSMASRLTVPDGISREGWDLASGGKNLSQLWLDGKIPGALGKL